MLAVMVFTAMINFKFSSSAKSGKLFGTHIYVMDSDDMSPELDNGSAIISDSDDIQVLTEGNVVLFRQSEDFERVMRIREVVHNTDSTVYKVSTDSDPDNTIDVDKSDIIAKCNKESHNLGKLINFLKSTVGIIVGLLIPCIVLLVVIIVKIVSVRGRDDEQELLDQYDDDDYFDDDDEEDEDDDSMTKGHINPLFVPDATINQDEEFEKKKSSIAKNFGQKTAARRETRRIPTEKESENAVEKFKAAVEEKPSAPVTRRATLAPEGASADTSEKMEAIKTALSQETGAGYDEVDTLKTRKIIITDEMKNQSQLSSAAVKKASNESAQAKTAAAAKASAQKKAAKPKAKKADDNIKSIDDLIKALEEEKKKL
jgi:hypothetical protein